MGGETVRMLHAHVVVPGGTYTCTPQVGISPDLLRMALEAHQQYCISYRGSLSYEVRDWARRCVQPHFHKSRLYPRCTTSQGRLRIMRRRRVVKAHATRFKDNVSYAG
jgi:hypothetical protein